MKSVICKIDQWQDLKGVPSNIDFGGVLFSLSGQPSQTITTAPYEATFTNVPSGTAQFTAQAVDTNGNALGTAIVSDPFVVPDDSKTISVPLVVSASVQ